MSLYSQRRLGVGAMMMSVSVIALGCTPAAKSPRVADAPSSIAAAGQSRSRPAVIGPMEGERRLIRGEAPLFIKIDPTSTGSEHLVLGSSDLPPGDAIGLHRHLREDEIILITHGSGRLQLGRDHYAVVSGATVFIPQGTCVALVNTGTDTLSNVFVFSAPGFEHVLRAVSTAPGEPPRVLTPAERAAAFHEGHAEASPPDC